MRKYQRKVLEAWREGRKCTTDTMRTDGETIWSYQTPILKKVEQGWWLDTFYFSRTTSSQQIAIRNFLNAYNIPFFVDTLT